MGADDIVELQTKDKARKCYRVNIQHRHVYATVTSSAAVVDWWVNSHLQAPLCGHYEEIVGLDVEWRPSFTRGVKSPVAVLQLCIRKCCLIFQIHRASCIPGSLYRALSNPNITYSGVRITSDAKKLSDDYDLEIEDYEDVAKWAAYEYNEKGFKKAGLKTLVENILGEEMEKPKHVAMSDWEAKKLTCEQVKYACVDAYYSYKLGKFLLCD